MNEILRVHILETYRRLKIDEANIVAFPVALLLMFAPELWTRIRGRK